MGDSRAGGGLGIIFSFFLGLMVTAFFGLGVHTLFPYPTEYDEAYNAIVQEQQQILGAKRAEELTDEERARRDELTNELQQLRAARRAAEERRYRNTSILLVTLATLTMAISLVRSHALPVISNGLLLGGLFTMVYGIGWVLVSSTTLERFLVVTLALVVTLSLGYVRFVRQRTPARTGRTVNAGASPVPTGLGGVDLAEIERRLQAIERRLDRIAAAFADDAGSQEDR